MPFDWTEKEVTRLRDLWQCVDQATLISRLAPRTWIAIRRQAARIGLPFGVPSGHETLNAAARRSNITAVGLRSLLARHHVRLVPMYQHHGGEGKDVRCVVEPAAVDRAIAADMRLECIADAARRLRIAQSRLRAGLVACWSGTIRRGHPTRVDPEVFDRAAALVRSGVVPLPSPAPVPVPIPEPAVVKVKEKCGRKVKDRTGQAYGCLVAIEMVKVQKYAYWRCRCEPIRGGCGRECIVAGTNLGSGNSQTCGCGRGRRGRPKMTTANPLTLEVSQ